MSEQLVLAAAPATVSARRSRSFAALSSALRPLWSWTGGFGLAVLLIVVFIAAFAPLLAPYSPTATQYDVGKQVLRLDPPSAAHWLGTTNYGVDVLSQLIYGSRIVLIVGITCALLIGLIGTNIGLLAGYYRGRVDTLLMRLTDLAFGIPFLPFAVVLVTLLRPSLWNTIIAISVLMWRTSARVIRVQVLSLRERGFVKGSVDCRGVRSAHPLHPHFSERLADGAALHRVRHRVGRVGGGVDQLPWLRRSQPGELGSDAVPRLRDRLHSRGVVVDIAARPGDFAVRRCGFPGCPPL